MLDDRDRRELAELERHLRTDDPELVSSFTRDPPGRCRPGVHGRVRTTLAAAVLLLPAVLLLGAGLTVVLLVAAAVVVWVLDSRGGAGPGGRAA